MRISSKAGKREIHLTKGEHDLLRKAQALCVEIQFQTQDTDARDAKTALDSLAFKYPAPEPKKEVTK